MKLFLIVFVALYLGVGCSGDNLSNSITSDLPLGTLYGGAELYDGTTILKDLSGINVSLEGTGYSTVTDKFGNWEIDNLPTRTYTIAYSKPGYGTMKQHGVVFVGGGHVSAPFGGVRLYRVPSCSAVLDVVREEQPGVISVYSHSLCEPKVTRFAYFFSNSPNVSSSYFQTSMETNSDKSGMASVGLNSADSYFFKDLNKKDSIYVVVYNSGGGSYFDPTTGKVVYPSIYPEPSRVLSALLK